ncbi:hypothetical protein [Deinococcus ruber]|uniref:Uncharacterized protein n=1 Tax=Deinococcus ruber TaxID=1848197 RepID=A0A918C841_9DEIO|nr:hypothetical protein [Deinococcus ruber]GGR10437.1 hypothetical protein GCM10008957_23880 [Deinococcus ruber]
MTVAENTAKSTGVTNLTNAIDSGAGTLTSSTLTFDLAASGIPAVSVTTLTIGTFFFQTKIN